MLIFIISLFFSSLMCNTFDTRESDAELEAQNMTAVAEEATRFSRNVTETAQASITPTITPTSTGFATQTITPTSTSAATPTPTGLPAAATAERPNYTFDSNNLPAAVFSVTDPSGDTYWCESGGSFGDPAVDILSINIYDPQSLGATHQFWLVRVELGMPVNTTFANDWSGSVLVAYAAPGAPAYTITYNEIHAGHITQGTLDASGQAILPGTADNTFIDDQGNVWFLVPEDTLYMQAASFHTPTEDLPPDQKRCDVAPNQDVYTLDLH
jgi:hypothetical protein